MAKKKILSVLLAIAMIVTMLPAFSISALADEVHTDVKISGGNITLTEVDGIKYINDEPYVNRVCVTDADETIANTITIQSGEHNVTINNISVSGIDVVSGAKLNLTLEGENTVTANGDDNAAVNVPEGAELIITEASIGMLTVKSGINGAGIGGNYKENSGSITIAGGSVTATSEDGAGIGGGYMGDGNNIIIAGGSVIATSDYGAGIGGGRYGEGNNITITDGSVTATSGSGAGIGGGRDEMGNYITITGGSVTATSDYGAGIGGGYWGGGNNITITGGEVTATSTDYGAGIGGGYWGDGNYITITGGTVEAISEGKGAGIGGGYIANGINIEISGGTVEATSNGGAGIGGGKGSDSYESSGENITIKDGKVKAVGGADSAGIGGGYRGSGKNIEISGGTVEAWGGENGAGIGGGKEGDSFEGNGENITITGGTVTAIGGASGAGIGGGYEGSGKNITITGGTVTATGGKTGAGIGGGSYGTGIDITITGGTVTVASTSGAGIGGGSYSLGSGKNITITGGTVTATSTDGAGIGGGYYNKGDGITITGGTVTATSTDGAGIGGGYKGEATNIKVAPEARHMINVKETEDNTDTIGSYTTETDITSAISGKVQLYIYKEKIEKVKVTIDGEEKDVPYVVELGIKSGDTYTLPENVVGYYIDEKFVDAGKYEVEGNEVITTVYFNITMVNGAQVRYGGGLDENGKINAGNGLRFLATVDRSNFDATGYGMKITAEGSDKETIVNAEKWQDDTTFSVAITDMAESNYIRKFTATPFVRVTYDDGTEKTIYGTETVTRSIYQVSAGLLTDNAEDTDELATVLNAYANQTGIRLVISEIGGEIKAHTAKYGDILHFSVSDAEYDAAGNKYSVILTAQGNAEIITDNNFWYEYIRINNNNSLIKDKVTVEKVEEREKAVKVTFAADGLIERPSDANDNTTPDDNDDNFDSETGFN